MALLNRLYVWFYGVDLKEHKPLDEYKTLTELFTRKLKNPNARFKRNAKTCISPADSLVTQHGTVKNSTLLQVKGRPYSLNKLLKKNINLENGQYINLYLSPKNYHRYHAPCDLKIEKAAYIPGRLFPVNKLFLNLKKNLFVENKRVVLECRTKKNKKLYMVFVGAFNVGKICFSFKKLPTTVKQGDELGYFS
ncbi:archaetidylserine decarboxylase, partial [Candidatus Woesearchaeota archaeon]|nr:archaetidylserine decarboxylase [Candidatus Woesearchaeota archaeon]